jgi:hypothetical protein
MSFQLLLVLVAVLAFVGLGALRIGRVRAHRDAPDGWLRFGFVAAFLLIPPIVLQVVLAPKGIDAVGAVTLYVGAVVLLWVLTWVVALLVARFAPVEGRQMMLLALIGRDTSGIVPFDPPMTATLAAEVEAVDLLNAAFPRGHAFMAQVSMPGFRTTWEALDTATRTLEDDISEQRRLHLGVSEQAIETANDARGRLDTLRRDAATGGQAWAV